MRWEKLIEFLGNVQIVVREEAFIVSFSKKLPPMFRKPALNNLKSLLSTVFAMESKLCDMNWKLSKNRKK